MGTAVPIVHFMPDAFVPEDLAESFVVFAEGVFFSDQECDVHFAQLIEPLWAVQAGEKVGGRVEVDVFAVVAVEKIAKCFHVHREVETSGKDDEFVEKVRVAEGDVAGVEGP